MSPFDYTVLSWCKSFIGDHNVHRVDFCFDFVQDWSINAFGIDSFNTKIEYCHILIRINVLNHSNLMISFDGFDIYIVLILTCSIIVFWCSKLDSACTFKGFDQQFWLLGDKHLELFCSIIGYKVKKFRIWSHNSCREIRNHDGIFKDSLYIVCDRNHEFTSAYSESKQKCRGSMDYVFRFNLFKILLFIGF